MEKYYVNTEQNINGHSVVHKSECKKLPSKDQLYDLGLHLTCTSAVLKAKSKGFIFSKGCKSCIENCHSYSNKEKEMAS
jgi:hypothetical protein